MYQTPQAILQTIHKHRRFLISTHENPDGDALGSLNACGLILQRLGKEITLFLKDPPPFNFEWLPRAADSVQNLPSPLDVDVTILLDCSDRYRVGDPFVAERNPGTGIVVNIDHHATNDDFGDQNWVEPTAAATAHLVHQLATDLGVPIDLPLAENIYCGIMTDTGSFRYSNTSPQTMELAAKLLQVGVEPWKLASEVYENQPLNRLLLLQLALKSLQVADCGRYASIVLTRQMFADTGSDSEMIDGFINYARAIRGVEVALMFLEGAAGEWHVSFRSRGRVDVSAIAARFGGGGHRNAAGCSIQNNLDAARSALFQVLDRLLGEK